MEKHIIELKLAEGVVSLIETEYFEQEFYKENEVSVIGTVDLSKPLKENESCKEGVYICKKGYPVQHTFPSQILGYYKESKLRYLRVMNGVEKKQENKVVLGKAGPSKTAVVEASSTKGAKVPTIYSKFALTSKVKPALLMEVGKLLYKEVKNKTTKEMELALQPNAIEALKSPSLKEYKIILLEEILEAKESESKAEKIKALLKKEKINIDAYVLYHPDEIPLAQLLNCLGEKRHISTRGSFFIGSDAEFGEYVEYSKYLPFFYIGYQVPASENYATYRTLQRGIQCFFSGEYLKKKTKKQLIEKHEISALATSLYASPEEPVEDGLYEEPIPEAEEMHIPSVAEQIKNAKSKGGSSEPSAPVYKPKNNKYKKPPMEDSFPTATEAPMEFEVKKNTRKEREEEKKKEMHIPCIDGEQFGSNEEGALGDENLPF